ncbi:MAG: Hsp70 family protein [Rikenellaceae bacterium]|nr:Hsp70 family protein [Rikenellaceae bacterium]
MAKRLGIDLGTTNSCVSIYSENEMKVLRLEPNKETMPSVVQFKDGKLNDVVVGTAAKRRLIIKPNEVFSSIKSLMRDDKWKENKDWVDKFTIEGKLLSPTYISAIILKELVRLAKDNNEIAKDADEYVICVPANSSTYKQYIYEAAIEAGLCKFDENNEVIRDEHGNPSGIYILDEPSAAAIAYAQDKGFFTEDKKSESIILVYDFGGGTFDVSILKLTPAGNDDATEVGGNKVPDFKILSTKGIPDLGGDKIDAVLIEIIAKQFYEQYDIDLLNPKKENRGNSPKKVREALSVLKEMAEEKKIEFSVGAESVQFEHNCLIVDIENDTPCKLDIVVNRNEFLEAIKPLIDSSLDCVADAIKAANLTPDDIDRIILAGGSSKAPWVRAAISERFSEPYNPKNTDTIVAMGAARYGAGTACEYPQPEGPSTVIIKQITTHHYGIEIQGGYFSPLVEKGLEFNEDNPEYSHTAIYSNPNDSGSLKITGWATQEELELINKDGVKIATSNVHARKDGRPIFTFIGEYEVSIPKAPKGSIQVELTLTVASNNTISVKAKVGDEEPQLAKWKM